MLVLFIGCWGRNLSIQARVGNLNRDLHQPSRIRYVSRSFSVRCLASLAYGKGLISVVSLSVVVAQAIGSFLRNRIGDHIGELLVISFGGFIGIQCSWIALISLFLSRVLGHVFLVVSNRSKFCLSLSVYLLFYLFFFLYVSFGFTVVCTRGFYWYICVYTRVFCTKSCMPWVLMIAESPWMLLESVYTSISDQRCFLVWIF